MNNKRAEEAGFVRGGGCLANYRLFIYMFNNQFNSRPFRVGAGLKSPPIKYLVLFRIPQDSPPRCIPYLLIYKTSEIHLDTTSILRLVFKHEKTAFNY
ncbi:MAG: hypothetical protein J7K40_06490 [candidate division Zixibacteria bacterium]|nr:hypothetical protein [candidate division Zixibacteria bacterium]